MKRPALKRVGKIGTANIEARKRIAAIAEEKHLNYCEIHFDGCLQFRYLAPAHRHKRSWYNGDVGKLSDHNEWVAACQHCHDKIEHDAALTEEVFNGLRPNTTE